MKLSEKSFEIGAIRPPSEGGEPFLTAANNSKLSMAKM